MIVSAVTDFLTFLTILGDIGLILFVGLLLLQYFSGKTYFLWKCLIKIGKKYGLLFAFLIVTGATVGSLFYSEFLGYNPCKLCWIQRIFIYPQVVILGTALVKQFPRTTSGAGLRYSAKPNNLKQVASFYSILLSVIGIPIAAYQYYLQRFGGADTPCSAVDYSESCAQNFVLNFGYVTIPMMSLTAFGLIIASIYLYNQAHSQEIEVES